MRSQIRHPGHGGRAGRLHRSLGTFAVLAILAVTAALRPAPIEAQVAYVVAGHVGSSPATPGGAMIDAGTEVRTALWGVRLGVGTDAAGTALTPLAPATSAGGFWASDVDLGLNLGGVPRAGALLGRSDATLFLGAGGAGVTSTDAESGERSHAVVPTWSLGARGGYPITQWLGLEVEARRRAPVGEAASDRYPTERGWEYRAGLALRFGGAASVAPTPPVRAAPDRLSAPTPRMVQPVSVTVEPRDMVAEAAVVAARAVETAEGFLGTPYRWGGTTPTGFDCSGFVQYVFRQQGIELPRVSRDQAHAGRAMPTSLDDLAPGDLLFFAQGGPTVDHVAIYAGAGRIVHSSRSGYGVRFDELSGARGRYYAQHLVAVRRVVEGVTLVSREGETAVLPAAPTDGPADALEEEGTDAAPAPESGR